MGYKSQRVLMLLEEENELAKIHEQLRTIKNELNTIRALSQETLIKAQISSHLLVVRKIGEDKLEALNELLD